jgi:acetyl esterase/lipase
MQNRLICLILFTSFSGLFFGCAVVQRVGIGILYQRADLPQAQVLNNISYNEANAAVDPQQQLNLFLPQGTNWPILIFVHGGGWDSGDKDLKVGGADVYGNIGRFFASHGIGAAVINYRLQPSVTWRGQIQDVMNATSWVHSHISQYGGDPQNILLMGHSAGAQLAAHVALNAKLWTPHKATHQAIRGVICVSGAGLDLTDKTTYELGEKLSYYEARFRMGNSADWQREASPVTYIERGAPPFLILYGGHEKDSLKRQAQLLGYALSEKDIKNELVAVSRQNHTRIVLTLSRSDKTSGPAMLAFIRNLDAAADPFAHSQDDK